MYMGFDHDQSTITITLFTKFHGTTNSRSRAKNETFTVNNLIFIVDCFNLFLDYPKFVLFCLWMHLPIDHLAKEPMK